ncbi:MAG: serine/threonine protein kinase, partial [Planctomycetes bacterium]|nr:serine/threonine protein kinase [Planctomycetota bacterium]
ADDTSLNRVVAIKVLAPELSGNPTACKRFLREARAAAAIVHQHVVTIHAVDEDRLPYLVMEYVDGQSLQEKIDREGHLELKEVLRIGQQMASGLAAAHAHGLIHRDVKPANILLENGVERVRITDFGLARAVDDAGISRAGEVAGTPQYMSPEQAQDLAMDARSDLFSLGSVLYAMCTGRPPFRAESTIAAIRRVCDDTPRPIREINPEVPNWLVELIDRLLRKNRDERIQTAAEVADLLGWHLAHVQDPDSKLQPPSLIRPWFRRYKSRQRWLMSVVALLLVGIGIGLTELTGVTNLVDTGERPGKDTGQSKERPTDQSVPQVSTLPTDKGRADRGSASATDSAQNSPSPEMTETRRFIGHEAVVWSVAFSPDGSRALSGSGGRVIDGQPTLGSDFTVRLWDVASGQQLRSFQGHQHQVQSVAFTPDGRHAVGAGKIWAWRRWDVETGQELAGVPGDRGKPFFHLALSADAGRLLSWGGKDKVLRLWDVTAGTELWNVEGFSELVSAAAFASDGRQVATGGGGRYEQIEQRLTPGPDYSIRLWNAISGKEEFRLRGHNGFIRGLAFLPDGRRLLSGGADDVLRLWDLQTRAELSVYQGHTRGVNAIALSADGRWALSGSADTTVRLWDVETGAELCRFVGHTGEVRTVAISPDCRYALSGGYDETVRLWQLPELEK